jgi:asparagine synthase (glutamine-hydrolysing)
MIPTFLVSKLTRRFVTVALSGDGGDELFGGYTAYDSCARYFDRQRRVPPALRRIAADCITGMPANMLDTALSPVRVHNAGARLHRAASVLRHESTGLAYRAMISQWEFPEDLVVGASEPGTPFADPRYTGVAVDEIASMMLLDAAVYLTDDILVKVDRASMAVSLESRCPLLDYRLFELAWRLPMRFKRRDGVGKWILKQLAYKLVPRELLDRPKAGFAVPIGEWLRGPLREWGGELLDSRRLRQEGLLDPKPIQAAWKAHLEGRIDNSSRLWTVLMLESWLDRYHNGREAECSTPAAAMS